MNNPLKLVVGSLLGAGIGVGISKAFEGSDDGIIVPTSPPLHVVYDESPPSALDSLKNRWERAKVDGELAKRAREEELRAYFRVKVNDPQAMPAEGTATPASQPGNNPSATTNT